MAATARLVVQMTPDEKNALDARARQAGVSTAEFVRRRIGPDDIDEHREEIEALLTALEESGPNILRSLDSALAAVVETESVLDDLGRRA